METRTNVSKNFENFGAILRHAEIPVNHGVSTSLHSRMAMEMTKKDF